MNSMSFIHPQAKIGTGVEIGPFCYIDKNVEIGNGCRIGPHVTIFEHVRMGRDCQVWPGAVLGGVPQDLKFAGEESYVEIGERNMIREFVTIHRGTAASGKLTTRVGDDNLIMCYVHIAHDCRIGNHCILSGKAGLAGEVDVDDWAIVGGGALLHQFTHLGSHAMLGGGCILTKDVPPYALAGRNPVSFEGVNLVGLRRRGFTHEQIEEIRRIYRIIYNDGLNVSDACRVVEQTIDSSELRETILSFVRGSSRGIIR